MLFLPHNEPLYYPESPVLVPTELPGELIVSSRRPRNHFRTGYGFLDRLPLMCAPTIALSGSIPLFALPQLMKRLGISKTGSNSDCRIIHGGDITGTYPQGFTITVDIDNDFVRRIATFVRDCLGVGPCRSGAVHVFVDQKATGSVLLGMLEKHYTCLRGGCL